ARALAQAHEGFAARASREERDAFARFREENREWLEPYALYRALRERHDERPWWEWPPELRDRAPAALAEAARALAPRLESIHFEQFAAVSQWNAVRALARERGILLLGDMPIFVAHDSAEVWAYRERFKLDAVGLPRVVAGVPPDYFSATGQRWGNPIYDWEYMRAHGFRWWIARLRT